MSEQRSFASVAWSQKGKVTRRERFLGEMEAVIPWRRLIARIEPHYPKAGRGRRPHDLERMLRIYFLQQWFNLSDPQAEDAIYDSESMRRFAKVELAEDVVPDETTILRFRHLLETHRLTEVIFEAVKVFPFPILGALLLFEGFALVKLVTKVQDSRPDLLVALLVGVLVIGFRVIGVPFGFLVGILGGTAVYYLLVRKRILL